MHINFFEVLSLRIIFYRIMPVLCGEVGTANANHVVVGGIKKVRHLLRLTGPSKEPMHDDPSLGRDAVKQRITVRYHTKVLKPAMGVCLATVAHKKQTGSAVGSNRRAVSHEHAGQVLSSYVLSSGRNGVGHIELICGI